MARQGEHRPAKLMRKFPFFGKDQICYDEEKLLLVFEYGVVISQVARDRGVDLTKELIEKAETMIKGEARTQSSEHMAVNMIPNILSVFELDLSK